MPMQAPKPSSKQRCARCEKEEYIPTHQYVKFDEKIYYLCESCWSLFRRWFYAPKRMNLP